MTVLAWDDFNYANGALDAGQGWSNNAAYSGTNTITISTNAAKQTSNTADALATMSNATLGVIADGYVQCWFGTTDSPSGNTNHDIGYGVVFRSTTNTKDQYRLVASAAGYSFGKMVSGTFTNISHGAGTTFASGDCMRLEMQGTAWRVYKNGVLFDSGTDSSFANGYPGLMYSSSDTTAGGIDKFEAGDLNEAHQVYALDFFDRAAENPLASPWSTTNTLNACRIPSSPANTANGTASGVCGARYTGLTPSNDQWARVTVGATVETTTDTGVGPCIRVASAALTMYFGQGNTTETRLYKVVAASYTKLGRDAAAVAAGDILTITAKSNAIALMKNGVTIAFSYDTGGIASGDPGIWATGAAIPNLDAFQCGTFAALPVTSATDSFNRANENPISTNWTTVTGVTSGIQLSSNQVAGISATTDNASAYTGATFPDDQYSEATYTSGAQDSGPTVRVSTAQWTGYYTWSSGSTHHITRYNNGTNTDFSATTGGPKTGAWVVGDRIGMSVVGYPTATVTLWRNGVPIHSILDSSAIQSGSPGLYIYNTGATTFDDWVGGNLGSVVSSAVPRLMMMGIGD